MSSRALLNGVVLALVLSSTTLAQEENLAALVQPARVGNQPLGPVAKQALELASREVAGLRKQLKPWAGDPRARIFTQGGSTEHHVRPQTQAMIAFAVVARFAPDEASRKAALEDLVAMLRFVAPTHSIGPVKCTDGKKWHNQWQSALWAFQAGEAAWLVWDQLDDEIRKSVAAMVAGEADRFIDAKIPFQIKLDTKAEENSWNSTVVALAVCMMPRHPRAQAWRTTAIRWQLSSFLRPEDVGSETVIEGKSIKDWKLGANIHSDYSLENHDRVHPSYMACIGINLMQHLVYRWAGEPGPASLDFNTRPMHTLLKRFMHPDGRMHFPNGQDWELHRLWPNLDSEMALLLNDSQAAYLERVGLETMAKMQARTEGGPTLLPHEYFFQSLPGMVATSYAMVFLWHLEKGDGPAPCTKEEFLRDQCGVWKLDAGKFIMHRTARGFVSFSWGQRVMGQAIPFMTDLLGSPYELSFVGTIGAKGVKEKSATPVVKEVDVTAEKDGFVVRAALGRAGGSVRQDVVFISMPQGAVLYAERLMAVKDVELDVVRTGTIGVINEPEWVYQNGPRRLVWEGGSAQVDGRRETADLAVASPWLTIDDAWSFVAVGAEGFAYDANHKPSRGRREQFLHLVSPLAGGSGKFKAGQTIATRGLSVGLMTNAASARQSAQDAKAQVQENSLSVTMPGGRYVIRFGEGLPEVQRE